MEVNTHAFHRRCHKLPACESKNPMHCGSCWGAPWFDVCQLVAAAIDEGCPVQFLPARLAREGSLRMQRRQRRLEWRKVLKPHWGLM